MALIKFDQHLMVDLGLLKRIASKCKRKTVVEIGPGNGALTFELLKNKNKVIAYEIDKDKIKLLKKKFSEEIDCKKLIVYHKNALEENLNGDVLFSNLPYSISEPLFYKLIKAKFNHIFLVTGNKFYNHLIGSEKLGFFRKTFFNIKFFEEISKTTFMPQPNVNSCFFGLYLKDSDDFYSEFLAQFDKKVKNALIEGFCRFYSISKNKAKEKLKKMGLKEQILQKRVYHLSNLQFKGLISVINSKL